MVQTAVQLSATLSQVQWLLPVSAAVGLTLAVVATRLRLGSIAMDARAAPSIKGLVQDGTLIGWAVLMVALAICFGGALVLDNRRSDAVADYILFFGCLAFLGTAWWLLVADKKPAQGLLKDSPATAASQFGALAILVCFALIPLFFHKPSSDDALFLNLAEEMNADSRAKLNYEGI